MEIKLDIQLVWSLQRSSPAEPCFILAAAPSSAFC